MQCLTDLAIRIGTSKVSWEIIHNQKMTCINIVCFLLFLLRCPFIHLVSPQTLSSNTLMGDPTNHNWLPEELVHCRAVKSTQVHSVEAPLLPEERRGVDTRADSVTQPSLSWTSQRSRNRATSVCVMEGYIQDGNFIPLGCWRYLMSK